MEEEKKEKGFVIKDRRLFDESGEARTSDETAPADEPAEQETGRPQQEDRSETDFPGDADEPLPEVSFASFVFSLSTTAMYHFGDFVDPATGKPQRNLPAAKQTIDILNILRTKTEGNLDPQEKELLDGMLYELRMRFVKEMAGK